MIPLCRNLFECLTLTCSVLRKLSLGTFNQPCHLSFLLVFCYFNFYNSLPFLLMSPHGMLHICYYFYISESIIYSSFMFSCPLWYYPDWQFSQHVCLPVCLSVSLLSVFYGHPLMTHQSLSPLIFFLSSGLVFWYL